MNIFYEHKNTSDMKRNFMQSKIVKQLSIINLQLSVANCTLLIVFCLFFSATAWGQTLVEYTFSTGTDASKWVDITTGATPLIAGSAGDSKASEVKRIGFTFPFGEETYENFSVNTDGNLRLGNTVTSTSYYTTPFSSSYSNSNNPKINAFGCDGYSYTANHYVKSKLVESTKLVVEFCLGTYTSTTRSYEYKWQIHLYSTGVIEIVFPDSGGIPSTAPAVAHQCGLCVNSSDGWIISSSNNTATHFTAGSTTTNAASTWFGANRYYRFAPPVISCPKPRNVHATTLSKTSATIEWESDASNWTIHYGTSSTLSTYSTATASGDPTKNLTGLTANTTYYVQVQANCGGGDGDSQWSAISSFKTLSTDPQDVGNGWSDDFEGTVNWAYVNGGNNAWVVGTGVNNGGSKSLYITNNTSGTPPPNEYTNNAVNIVYATKLFNFGDSDYIFEYDWQAYGEGNYDYIRAWLAPAGSATFTAGNLPDGTTSTNGYTTATPSGWIPLDNDGETGSKLNLVTTWQSKSLTIPVPAGTYYMVFMWANDGSSGTNPPAAIDNFSITKLSCRMPSNLIISNITENSADISWTYTGSATQWQYTIDDGANWTTVNTTSATLSLSPNTPYTVKVRTYCGAEDQSGTIEDSFRTECATDQPIPYREDFDEMPTSIVPYCWTRIEYYSSYPYVYGSGAHSGSNCLYMYTYTSTNSQSIIALPPMDDINTLQIEFQAKYGTLPDEFYVGYIRNGLFTPLSNNLASSLTTTYQEFTVYLNGAPNDAESIAFRMYKS